MLSSPVRFVHVALIALFCIVAGCEKPGESTATTGPSTSGSGGGSAGPIKIGEYGSMTGSEATFGISTDNGVKLAVKERNAAGGIKGRQIQLIAYDDQGKAQEVVTSVTRLIQQEKVVAIIGEVASSLSIAGGQQCQRFGVPMISPSSTNAMVTQIGDMVSRVCFIDGFQGFVGAKFATDTLKLKKAATLYNRAQAYSAGLKDDFRKAFTEMGGQVLIEQAYGNGDNDFSAQLTAIREKNPDFIYIPSYYTEVVNIAKQARKLGITCVLLGSDGWVSEDLKNAGSALDGCFFTDHYSQEDKRPEVQEFLKKYQAEYGKTPDSMAALGYDAARLLFDAMERSPSLTGKDLAAAIAATKDFPGVTGKITLNQSRDAVKLAVVQKIQGGVFSYYATVEPPNSSSSSSPATQPK